MTTLTTDSDFEEAARLPDLAVQTHGLSARNNTSLASLSKVGCPVHRMAFSIPYLQSGVAVLVRKDIQNVDNLEKLAEIKATVGAQINTTSYYFLQKYEGIKIKTYEKFGHAVIDLANKGNDAVVGDSVQVNYYFNKNNELTQSARFLGSRMTSEFYGIVLRKDDIDLKQKIDASLTALLNNGTIQKLHDKWNLGKFAVVPLPEN